MAALGFVTCMIIILIGLYLGGVLDDTKGTSGKYSFHDNILNKIWAVSPKIIILSLFFYIIILCILNKTFSS